MLSFVIAADHPSLPGHFPGRPLVPGVVLLDRVLDAVAAAHARLGLGPLAAPLRLPQVKFLEPLLPGEAARIELLRPDGAALRWRFRVLREADARLLASGEVVAAGANAANAGIPDAPHGSTGAAAP